MKKYVAILLAVLLVFSSCGAPAEENLSPNDAPIISVDPEISEEVSPEENTPVDPPADTPADTPARAPEEPEKTPEKTPEETPSETPDEVPADTPTEEEIPLRAISFNVLAYDPDPAKFERGEKRAVASVAFLKEQDADIVGLQEAVDERGFNWVPANEVFDFDSYFRQELGSIYGFSGVNEAECYGEGLIILYRKSRFELKDMGAFEYTTNTNSFYHWVKLYDKKAGKELYVVNTHLSPNKNGDFEWGNTNRLPQSMQLSSFLEKTVKDSPLIATGDYNCKIDVDEYAGPHRNLQKSGRYMPSTTEAMSSDGSTGYDYVYFNIDQMYCDEHVQAPQKFTVDGKEIAMSDHRAIIADFYYN